MNIHEFTYASITKQLEILEKEYKETRSYLIKQLYKLQLDLQEEAYNQQQKDFKYEKLCREIEASWSSMA